MRILVTGGEGFVGRNLVEYFKGDNIDVLHPSVAELDLTCAESVSAYLNANPVETIIHSATTLREKTDYPVDVCENNLRMFFNLARRMTPQMKLINLGSGSEYCREYWHKKMPETFFDSYVPTDSHSYSKYIISKYIEDCRELNMITLRIFGIFGKYEDYRYKFISNAIVKNILNMPITINQNVNYDYIYIGDFYTVIKHFVFNNGKYRSYNVTPVEPIDLVSLVKVINKISDYQSDILVLNDGIGVDYSGNNDRLLEEINNLQMLGYPDAVNELYVYYKENLDSLDVQAVRDDDYLNYAKQLKAKYFESA
ncbi:NAD-dependent epimerase/dehydratase family protein [Methylomonas sp. YC3]